MAADTSLIELARQVGEFLLRSDRRLVAAESCTGGFIAKTLTDIPGSSHWFECGYVSYSNAAKMRDLGVLAGTLADHGAVSEATAREMAGGALRVSGAEVSISVTGIAGPDGAMPGRPVGTVWFGCALRAASGIEFASRLSHFAGNRQAVREQSVEYALNFLLQLQH
jgi:nicotinamide-nucleotide amidase